MVNSSSVSGMLVISSQLMLDGLMDNTVCKLTRPQSSVLRKLGDAKDDGTRQVRKSISRCARQLKTCRIFSSIL